ncbi:type II toxin-antitoxin system RelE/ParE family toxin [Desulfovibrio aerotolerans]|uniref:Type II toxin-antitoxin system RelE/ParE family toxin n=1 Tax=Solidesulfovibrio aerotolerans TaxID=295255 RepID=A0A7C9N314_9BACT|nr:type II toxin-antitoxin system RelE/ParE family toxin [Solidesulfovibrio aerotolerans]MYL85317.1 type II toxin-antitoxin system RelE/ParE family toxin [Solidesulfovibrio aerotolerans]
MPIVLKLPQAEADLNEIWLYIARDNIENADSFLEKIEARCLSLAEFPRMGISREELAPFLRSLSVGNYIIFYKPIENGIVVVRVLQGMRDIEAVFDF